MLRRMFDLIDANKDHFISKEELGLFFKFNESQKDFLDELMQEADENNDGYISFEEFSRILLK